MHINVNPLFIRKQINIYQKTLDKKYKNIYYNKRYERKSKVIRNAYKSF